MRFKVVAIAVVLAVLYAGKHYYSEASAADLRWILAPTATLVSVLTGNHFAYEAGVGWVDRDAMFTIAPACAGVNFALAAFLALVLGWLSIVTTWRELGRRLALAAALAYVATLVVNTLRIAIAVELHRGPEVHRFEGICVYLGGLCLLYALATRRIRHVA